MNYCITLFSPPFAILSFGNFAGFKFREFVAATTLINRFGKAVVAEWLHY